MTDAEPIAIFIGYCSRAESAVELRNRMLHYYDRPDHAGLSIYRRIVRIQGILLAKAISIIAALKIGHRRHDTKKMAIDQF